MPAVAVVALTATALITLPSSAPTEGRVVREGRVAEVTTSGVATRRAGAEGIDARGK
jgi:hypothetical protein